MKVVKYIDLWPGIEPMSIYFSDGSNLPQLMHGNKRYRIEFEVPDYSHEVDGVVKKEDVKVEELKDG